jgi:flagellar motility protein MotE (MotC chaperone)
MIAAVGLVSFAGTFVVAWLTKPAPQSKIDESNQATLSTKETKLMLPPPEGDVISGVGDSEMKKAMTEKKLKSLIYEVREKMREYDIKLQGLEVQEQRLQISHSMIKKDLEELNNLRIELASVVTNLKNERDKLLKSRVEIAKSEKANLLSIAAAYDKMDSASAGKILTNMSQMQDGSGSTTFDDAVKILHYMTERTKAKLLAELVTSEPKLAAVLCQRLKQIIEEE